MKNWVRTMALLLGITAMMMTPALAADYEFDAPDGGMYAPPTSVDQVIVVGGGVTESSNIDRSKNTAIIAPPFGSPESYQPGAGTVLIPQASTATGNTGGSDTVYLPPASYVDGTPTEDTSLSSTKFTLPDGLYYTDGSIGRLKIPVLGLSVKVYENEMWGLLVIIAVWQTISERSILWRTVTKSPIPPNWAPGPTRYFLWGRSRKQTFQDSVGQAKI